MSKRNLTPEEQEIEKEKGIKKILMAHQINDDEYESKTIGIILTKIDELERDTSSIKSTVEELSSFIMPNKKWDWPGVYTAIQELAQSTKRIERAQEKEMEKTSNSQEQISDLKNKLSEYKKEVDELNKKILLKEREEKTKKEEEEKLKKQFEFKVKVISGVAAALALYSQFKQFF